MRAEDLRRPMAAISNRAGRGALFAAGNSANQFRFLMHSNTSLGENAMMSFRKSASDGSPRYDLADRGNVVWDAADGGAGPRVKDGVFTIVRSTLWSKLAAMLLLNLSMFGVAKATQPTTPSLSAAPTDMNVLLTETQARGPAVAANCQHHDSHNDKIMSTLDGAHLDQHGDLSC